MSYVHIINHDGTLAGCSEAVDMLHYWDDGRPPSLTGFGFCPHLWASDDPDDEAVAVVEVPMPCYDPALHKHIDMNFSGVGREGAAR